MKHERLMDIAGTFMRATLAALCLCAAAALAYGIHWHQANAHRYGRAPFSLVGTPASRRITAGAIAHYSIVIRRGRYRGKIRLSLASVGPGLLSRWGLNVGNRAMLRVTGQRAFITVKTALADPARRYSVKLTAVGGRYRGYLTMGLTVTVPESAPFDIAGNFGVLWPGTSQSVNLAVTNDSSQAISVRSLVVAIKTVTAPRATGALPCSAADFAVRQFAGSYPLKIPAYATRRLSGLGVAPTESPQLLMLDRPVNQDGCQGATVTLSYSGTATSP